MTQDVLTTTIVLDDDPTGTQTVHDVPVITNWRADTIAQEFERQTPLFFILTNSRAMLESEAVKVGYEIGSTIKKIHRPSYIISRGDSTLRGHFPAEIDALANGLGWQEDYLIVLAPAFFEGNRLTKDNIQYIKEAEKWIPVGESPYASDKTFGYENSNLIDWVIEKSKNRINREAITTISIEVLEHSNEALILNKIDSAAKVLIVNAVLPTHLSTFATIVKKSKRNILFRTAASFVSAFGNIEIKQLLVSEDLKNINTTNGGLIVVGSHVPKTTIQLNYLIASGINEVLFDVMQFLEMEDEYIISLSQQVNKLIAEGKDVVLYTSRKLISLASEDDSLLLSKRISSGIIKVIKNLKQSPSFLLAKGGITSSDIATEGLAIQRAMVSGQLIKGVPVWVADENSRFPKMTFVIFPGNVGDDFALLDAYNKLKK